MAAVALALAAYLTAPRESPATTAAALTRSYWFLSRWEWYEYIGLVAPLAILAWYFRNQRSRQPGVSSLAGTALLLGLTGLTVSLLFAHTSSSTYLIARLQPLRSFHLLYLLMVLILGAELGQRVLQRSPARWAFALLVLSYSMYLPARTTYSHSAHLEFRIANSRNTWVRAFLWARKNTPANALFAMDSEYNNAPDADTQIFRAIAERSAVPDRSKDAGVAAMARELAASWSAGAIAQDGLDHLSSSSPESADRRRQAALQATGADWIVLPVKAPTSLPCPYTNEDVRVCRLSEQ